MAVENKKVRVIRETKENIFNILKGLAPGVFGSKVWTDVKMFGEDPTDTSKLTIEFNEENGP